MNYITRNLESVMEYLEGLSNDELVSIHNEYCQSTGNSDDEIYNNDEDFFNTFYEGDVMGALRATNYGEWSFSHDYVQFNGYANLESFDDPSDNIDLSAIADDILENEGNYYDIELEDEEEPEEDEDEEEEPDEEDDEPTEE